MKIATPPFLRLPLLNVSKTFILLIRKKGSFIIFCLVLLAACTEPIQEAEFFDKSLPEVENEKLIEFRGLMSFGDENRLALEESNNLVLEKCILISWEFGESIDFSSQDYFFEEEESRVYGYEDCEIYGSHSEGLKYNGASYLLSFKPDSIFWECLSRENCDPGDPAFWFEIPVQEAE